MNIKLKILISVVGVILLGLAVFALFFSEPNFTEVKRGDIVNTVFASGKVVASGEVKLGFDDIGVIDKIYVNRQDKVGEGDLLVSLDSKKLQAEMEQAEAQIELSKAKLSQILAGTRNEELDLYEAQVELAQVELDNALKNFENTKIKTDSDLAQAYKLALDVSDPVLLTAENAINVLDSIYQPSNKFETFFFVSNSSKKSDAEWQIIFTRDAFLEIEKDVETLKENSLAKGIDEIIPNFKVNLEIIRLSLLKTNEALESASVVSGPKVVGEFINDIALARAEVSAVQTGLLEKEQAILAQKLKNQNVLAEVESLVNAKRAILLEKEGELNLKKAEPRKVEIAVYEAQIKEAEALKSLLKERIKNTNLYAPVSGVVKSVYLKKGALVSAGQAVVSMILVSDFKIEADILTKDAKKIKVGDEVNIALKAGDVFENVAGSVVNIYIEDEVSKVDIVFAKENDLLELGMDVELDIDATVKKGVLVVSRNAIFEEDGTKKAILFEDGDEREVQVEVGDESKDYVEILSGLYERDRVILP